MREARGRVPVGWKAGGIRFADEMFSPVRKCITPVIGVYIFIYVRNTPPVKFILRTFVSSTQSWGHGNLSGRHLPALLAMARSTVYGNLGVRAFPNVLVAVNG